MKSIMRAFYRPTDDEFKKMWETATFVLDTNVLLNLYRYPAKARDELLAAFEKIAARLWIPYHVALEYQRNRLDVIADQRQRFSDVRKRIQKAGNELKSGLQSLQLEKRHSVISVDSYLQGFDRLNEAFLRDLKTLEDREKNVSEDDPIRSKLDELFCGKVGECPPDQDHVEGYCNDGKMRYACQYPPGFKDANKEKTSEPESFRYGGLTYKRMFGDLIIWKQLMEYAESKKIKSLVFLTDDTKSDWWWIVEAEGSKTIGPRPELIDEIQRGAEVGIFWMYNSDQFLKYARQYLSAEVSDESIEQLKFISKQIKEIPYNSELPRDRASEGAVINWLRFEYPSAGVMKTSGVPTFVVLEENLHLGFHLLAYRTERMLFAQFGTDFLQVISLCHAPSFHETSIIVAVKEINQLNAAITLIQSHIDSQPGYSAVFGLLQPSKDQDQLFFREIARLSRRM